MRAFCIGLPLAAELRRGIGMSCYGHASEMRAYCRSHLSQARALRSLPELPTRRYVPTVCAHLRGAHCLSKSAHVTAMLQVAGRGVCKTAALLLSERLDGVNINLFLPLVSEYIHNALQLNTQYPTRYIQLPSERGMRMVRLKPSHSLASLPPWTLDIGTVGCWIFSLPKNLRLLTRPD